MGIKGQALADFIAEFTGPINEEAENLKEPSWELYVDGSLSEQGAGAGNSHADALACLATARDVEFLGEISVNFLVASSTEQRVEMLVISTPEDKLEARRLRAQAARYCIYDDKLYRRGFSAPLLRCIDGTDCQTVLEEIHAGHYHNHAGALSLAQKAL
ncbi:uncharacterized protein LOC127811168 [Diospyros lotus]|uniref:uncharacterized protein LOC127811168 n=1 Tax=Diospyros lotus TaxID=55363 RepID=UPI002253AC3A|nr:uncharacterized protein LOC127811168 [Diospyros lotus]